MAYDIGRISGIMLKDNLLRQGSDLAFENDLIYLDVESNKVGIKTASPTHDLTVDGTTKTSELLVDTSYFAGNLRIIDNSITTSLGSLTFSAAQQVQAPEIRTASIKLADNVISTYTANTNLELRPKATGRIEAFNDLNVNGDVYATGDITLGGSIIFGDSDTDSVTINADIASDIVPDQDLQYTFGRGDRRWSETHTVLINGQQLTTEELQTNSGINLSLRQGNIWYVSSEGSDTNDGRHASGAFASVRHALDNVNSGDTVLIYPGTYAEDFPLTVPQGVTVAGFGIRSVKIVPTPATETNNAFLLNGETTVSSLTVADFYSPGYAFSFAPGFEVTSRSPYINNISVITRGSGAGVDPLSGGTAYSILDDILDGGDANGIFEDLVEGGNAFNVTGAVDQNDLLGFNQGDAGRGALVDGSQALSTSNEASMLFHSVTFITPGVDALVMTNGVRVEWLNSFTYFANRGLYAVNGTEGFAGQGTKFGAEIRSIGSANVYGNYGAVVDGTDTLMYLIQHNFAYIGTGKDASNDKTLVIQANEAVKLNSGKIYYQSQDHEGTWRIGTAFFANLNDGTVSFDTTGIDLDNLSSLTVGIDGNITYIDADRITTGNLRLRGNTLDSINESVNITAASGEINFAQNVNVAKNINITNNFNLDGQLILGDQPTDTIRLFTEIEQDLEPDVTDLYSLGSTSKVWQQLLTSEANFGNVKFYDNIITLNTDNTDLNFSASGNGRLLISASDVEVVNNFRVVGLSELDDVEITGTINHTGNIDQLTGNFNSSEFLTVTENLTVKQSVFLPSVTISSNNLNLIDLDDDFIFKAQGSGQIVAPNNDVEINYNLSVQGTVTSNGVEVDTRTTTSELFTSDILISNNSIATTKTDSDLIFEANSSGSVFVETQEIVSNRIKNTDNIIFRAGVEKVIDIDSVGSLQIPAGNNEVRPTASRLLGDLRFNTADNTFEGFDGTTSRGMGGVFSANRATFVKAGKTSNVLNFVTAGTAAMEITTAGVRVNGLAVDNLLFDNSLILSNNTDLFLTPTGTGVNSFEQITFDANNIQNDASTAVVIAGTGNGYLRLTGTDGFVIPYGNDSDRTLTPEVGETRYNIEREYIEVWDGTAWSNSAGVGGNVTANDMEDLSYIWNLILG